MIGRTFGNYRIERLIGEGRIGSVFVAADLQQNRKVAIKFIQPNLANDPTFQQQFTREIQAASTLDHTGIVRVLQFSDTPGQLYIVMEYIAGGNLATYLKFLAREQKSVDSSDAMRFTQELADALEYAFRRQGMTHGDVKLENILLRTSGTSEKRIFQAMLGDFGAAKLIQSIPGPFAGPSNTSLPFMSPERCRGERVDTRSDIYALGVVCYYLTTGRLPFQPRSINEAVQLHTREAVVPPSRIVSTIPREIEQIILKSLAKNPNDRFQTPGEMGQALYSARFGGPSATHTVMEAAVPGGKVQRTYYADAPISPDMPAYGNFPASAGDVGKVRLVFSGQSHPASFLWFDKPVVTIGRDATNDIVLDSGQISRHHARVDRGYDGRYRIMDLRSTNGVYIGANKIPPNVPQEWAVGQIARVGDFWMRLELVNAPSAAQNVPGMAVAAPAQGFKSVPPAPVAAPPITDGEILEHDSPLLKTDFGQSLYTVSPGNRIVVPIKVTNQSEVNDRYSVEVRGLPSDWVTTPGEELRLAPQQTGGAQIIINPPRTGESLAGNRPFSILVRSFQKPEEYDSKKFQLQIESFYSFTTDLHPKRVRSNGSTEFYVTNNGNSQDVFAVTLDDPGEEVDIRLEQNEIKVDPGQTVRVPIRAIPRSRSIIGSSKSFPFRVSAKPKRAGGEQQVQTAELVVPPYLPYWALGGLGITGTGCFFVALLSIAALLRGGSGGFNLGNIFGSNNQPAALTAIATQPLEPLLTQAAASGKDSDVDGLTDTEEATLGTNANNPDTDADGLKDGLEVKSYNTNPNNQDTDADGLKDGDEVNVKGTNPNNPDTDGDGLLDGVDPQPLVKAPPTADAAASQAAAGTAGVGNATGTAGSATSAAGNLTATAAQATASVPAISINDPPPVVEGNVNGTTELIFTISLSKPNTGPNPITVNYAFIDGTAKNGADPTNANSDYNGSAAVPASPITFAVGGPTSQVLRVPIVSNLIGETSFETFSIQLSGATGASIAKGTGIGTISDDDSVLALPALSINDVTVTECNGSGTTAVAGLVVTMAQGASTPSSSVTVTYSTLNGSATAPGDYQTKTGTLTFAPSDTSKNLDPPSNAILIQCDAIPEGTESFSIVLSNAAGATIAKGTSIVTILDNDALPQISIADPTFTETDAAVLNQAINVQLLQVSTSTVTVNYSVNPGTATQGNDYTVANTVGTLTFDPCTTPPCAPVTPLTFTLEGDTIPEPTESFSVVLSGASGGTIIKSTGLITINDNDPLPQISIGDPIFTETDSNIANLIVPVTLLQTSSTPVTVNFSINPGTAVLTSDYIVPSTTGTLTFNPCALPPCIPVTQLTFTLVGDPIPESPENFSVILSGAVGATIVKSSGLVSIIDNDVAIFISIDNPSVTEGDGLTTFVDFVVTLSQPNPGPGNITVDFTTINETADSTTDYFSASGTLTFAPNESSKTISIQIRVDTIAETNETFRINLSNATPSSSVSILTLIGVASIIDDD